MVFRMVPSSPTTQAVLVFDAKLTDLRPRDVPVDRICHWPSPTNRTHHRRRRRPREWSPVRSIDTGACHPTQVLRSSRSLVAVPRRTLHTIVPSSPTAMQVSEHPKMPPGVPEWSD